MTLRDYPGILSSAILLSAGPLFAASIYVPDDYAQIQAALDAAVEGDTVWVRPGTYAEFDLSFGGKGVTLTSLAPEDPAVVEATVVDPGGLGRGFRFGSGEGLNTRLLGLTIRGGMAPGEEIGGGILCDHSAPVLRNLRLVSNQAYNGGGVACRGAAPWIEGVRWEGNGAEATGVALYCVDESAPTLRGCELREMGAATSIVSCWNSRLWMAGCLVTGADLDLGDAMLISTSDLTLVNCTVADNAVWTYGAALGYDEYSAVTVVNSIFWGNTPRALQGEGDGNLTVTYSDIQGGWTGVGNFDLDPGFVGGGDYRLAAGSPGIDAGDELARLDEDGTVADLGAYGGRGELPAGTLGGIVSGTLAAGQSYLAVERLWVPRGETLTLEPGVELRQHNRAELLVRGSLTAVGTVGDSIRLRPEMAWDQGGGVRLRAGATAEIAYATLVGLKSAADGGAVNLTGGATATLRNCAFRDNRGCGYAGVGVLHCTEGAVVTLADCDLIGNPDWPRAAAVRCIDSSVEVERCVLRGYRGGALNAIGSTLRLSRTDVVENGDAEASSGAVSVVAGAEAEIRHCRFLGNLSDVDGAAIRASGHDSRLVAENNLFVENSTQYGGAVYAYNLGWGEIRFCTFLRNRFIDGSGLGSALKAESYGGSWAAGGIAEDDSLTVENCVFWANDPPSIRVEGSTEVFIFNYNDAEKERPGIGNISADPGFVSHAGWCCLPGRESPLIDAGDPALEDRISDWHPAWPPQHHDGPRADMGAYGGPLNGGWVGYR